MRIRLLFLVSGIAWASSITVSEVPPLNPNGAAVPIEEAYVSSARSWLFAPQVSVVSPQEIVLHTDAHSLNYSQKLAGLPAVYAGLGWEFGELADIHVLGFARIGIAGKELPSSGITDPSIRESGSLRLLWVPSAIGTEIRYPLPGLTSVAPTLSAGMGVDYLYQSGNLDGVSGNFFVPTYFVSPGLFFSTGGDTDWFRGFNFGISYHGSFASPQAVRAWSFDLGIKVFL